MYKFTEGLEHKFSDGCAEKCGSCYECCLSVCEVCGQYEGGLTTHCPGNRQTAAEHDAYNELWDYRFGQWVEGIRNRVMCSNPQSVYENENKMLAVLEGEPTANAEFIREVKDYLSNIQFSVHRTNADGDEETLFDDKPKSNLPWVTTPFKYFPTPEAAKQYLSENGMPDSEIEECRYDACYKAIATGRAK